MSWDTSEFASDTCRLREYQDCPRFNVRFRAEETKNLVRWDHRRKISAWRAEGVWSAAPLSPGVTG